MSGVRLSPLDAAFLELEDADPGAHMHIGAVMVFSPAPGGGPPLYEEVLVHVDERLDTLPRLRSSLSGPTAGTLVRPAWREDDRFDLRAHVRHAALPAPAGDAELLEWAADFYAHRLERGRPLWELVLLDGLADGRWALALKAHHCLIDGVGGAELIAALLDGSDGSAAPGSGGASAAQALLAAGLNVARHPSHARAAIARAVELAGLLLRDEVLPAPPSSIDVPIGKQRRLATADAALDDLKAVKRALGGTVNDVALAAVTTGLRRMLLDRGERLPARGLRAMVPVNLGTNGDRRAGNRASSLFVSLPVAEPDALTRYRGIVAATAERKAAQEALATDALMTLAGQVPPALHAFLAHGVTSSRLFNVTVTNVRGSREPLSLLGAPMTRVIPIVPLAAGHALGIAVASYVDSVCFSAQADRDAVPDVETLTTGIAEGVTELVRAATAAPAAR